jgi:hypothetical protein
MPSPAWKPVRIYAPIRGVIRGWPAVVKKGAWRDFDETAER